MTCAGVSRTWQRICEDDQTWRQKCFDNGYVEFDVPSFRFLGGWAANRANEPAGITICSHMDLQEAQQNRQAREIAYGQCYEQTIGDSYQVSEDGKYIVCGDYDGTVDVFCGQTGAQLHLLRGHTDWVRCMSLHGTTLVSCSGDRTIRVWDIVDGNCLHILVVEALYCLQFDGERVVFDGQDFTVKVWNVHTEECLHTLTGHTGAIISLLFESQRDLVVSSSGDGTIRVWDVQRGACIAHLVWIQELEFTSYFGMQLRGNILAWYYDSDIFVWDIREGDSCIHHLHGVNGQTSLISSMQWLDSGLLVTGSDDVVKLWDAEKGIFVRDLVRLQWVDPLRYYCHLKATETLLLWGVERDDFKYAISLQAHPGLIITGSHDDKLRVWNVEDAQPAFTLTGQNGQPSSYQVSEDGKYIVCGGQDETVRIWCGQTGAQLHVLQGHTDWITCMSLHGTTLVSGSLDETLRVWDIVDGKCLHILAVDARNCVQFDGERVVSSGGDYAVNVWNVHTGECLHMLTGHTDITLSLLFESQRDLVVSGSRDGTIRVWDVQRGSGFYFMHHTS
ncbi:unnamed protein product, partial [Mesorhabditis belari]|uniref:F-box/WD repeat-containing protein 7 n=1 Tax=Mesorhabditis belari TaxID=2138241 RepID=A0AAF3F1C9_9BILA